MLPFLVSTLEFMFLCSTRLARWSEELNFSLAAFPFHEAPPEAEKEVCVQGRWRARPKRDNESQHRAFCVVSKQPPFSRGGKTIGLEWAPDSPRRL